MSDAPLYTIPTIDLSAKSLLRLSQLGIFAVFAYWSVEGGVEENIEYLFLVMMSVAGLALFLSVPNARMGVTLGVPALMVVMGLAMGENEMMFWAIFMFIMLGSIAYIPALATGDPTLGLDDETRLQRFGILWIVFALFMMVMMASLGGMAIDGEITEQDSDGEEFTMVLDSTQQTIAQAALGLGVIGVLVFLLTALMGTEIGPMLPWHGGAMVAVAMMAAEYLWTVGENAPDGSPVDYVMILCIMGLIGLTPCIAYKGAESDDAGTESEEA